MSGCEIVFHKLIMILFGSSERYRWGEPVEDNVATLRCTICDAKVAKNNFPRHLRSNSHLQNEAKYLKTQKRKKSKR